MFSRPRGRPRVHLPEPLSGVRVHYMGPAPVSGLEARQREEQAYRRGKAEAAQVHNRQVVELREEAQRLKNEVLGSVENRFRESNRQFQSMMQQINRRLPEVVMSVAQKVVAGAKFNRGVVRSILMEVLAEITPQENPLVVHLHPEDLELLQEFPAEGERINFRLKLEADPSLKRGDCQIKSDYGLIDARLEKNLAKIAEDLKSA